MPGVFVNPLDMSPFDMSPPALAFLEEEGLNDEPNLARSGGARVEISHLRKHFGDKLVLKDINLTIEAGQFVAIIGRSGCGKSTLLRILAGLDAPNEGSVVLRAPEEPAAHVAARIMFQEPRLLPWARVLENVEIGLGGDAAAIRAALRTLDNVGLGDRAQEWPAVLSGGQKQRVALARALVSRPRVLALDEPLGALDALTRLDMQGLIENVWSAQGFTALLVTHDVSEAVALADRIILLEEGVVALDTPVELPRPRRRGSVELALLEERLLKRLLKQEARQPEYVI